MNLLKNHLVRLTAPILVVLACGMCGPSMAQESEANNIFPEAPVFDVPPVHAIVRGSPATPRITRHRWLTMNNMSIATLVVGEAVDSWGTYRNVTHNKWICGNSPAFDGAFDTNVPGKISSLRDVQTICGAGPIGQSANWAFDVTRVGYFTEGGWVAQYHLADGRNYAAVEGWNLANDVAWFLVARYVGRRADRIGKGGRALNFARGIVHLELGIGNFKAVSHHHNPNTLNLFVPENSNYTAPRWWAKN